MSSTSLALVVVLRSSRITFEQITRVVGRAPTAQGYWLDGSSERDLQYDFAQPAARQRAADRVRRAFKRRVSVSLRTLED